MSKFSFCINSALFLCAGAAFVYGVVRFFKKKTALFHQLVVCGMGCIALGRLFHIVILLTSGMIPSGFSVGKLGVFGGFLFLFSASFGQMDGLVDGGEPAFRKYRLISFAAPLAILALYLPVVMSHASNEEKIVSAVISLCFAACAYYNLKHLLIPDVDMGIIQSIRGYNLTALILAVLSAAEQIAASFGGKIGTAVVTGLLCVVYLAVVPVLERGAKQWTM